MAEKSLSPLVREDELSGDNARFKVKEKPDAAMLMAASGHRIVGWGMNNLARLDELKVDWERDCPRTSVFEHRSCSDGNRPFSY